jgi:hypothetical protein
MNPILGIILECLGWCLRWVLLLPVLILVATPFILVVATFRPRPYRERVRELYGSVFDFWRSWGGDLTP